MPFTTVSSISTLHIEKFRHHSQLTNSDKNKLLRAKHDATNLRKYLRLDPARSFTISNCAVIYRAASLKPGLPSYSNNHTNLLISNSTRIKKKWHLIKEMNSHYARLKPNGALLFNSSTFHRSIKLYWEIIKFSHELKCNTHKILNKGAKFW